MEVDLLRSVPKPRRNVASRFSSKTRWHVDVSRKFGEEYFDGDRAYGYGGYVYDGRWVQVARDIIEHFKLSEGARILDVGCAKGFLVKDLVDLGMNAFGLDVSQYAVLKCPPEITGRVHLGCASSLPFPSNSFDAVVSINTIHNLHREGCVGALREIQRVTRGAAFVQVDSYRSAEEKAVFEDWVLTARYHGYPQEWLQVFSEAGYDGDWFWTVIE